MSVYLRTIKPRDLHRDRIKYNQENNDVLIKSSNLREMRNVDETYYYYRFMRSINPKTNDVSIISGVDGYYGCGGLCKLPSMKVHRVMNEVLYRYLSGIYTHDLAEE